MAAEFPLPSVSSNNPIPAFFELQPEEFVVGRTEYDDGGMDYKLQAGGAGVKRWVIRYIVLSIAQAAILDNWLATVYYSEDNGSAIGFNFRHHLPGDLWSSTAGTLFTNCHIAPGGYRKNHSKTHIASREILIEKRP
jgi:hypothetical protein